MNPPSPQPTAIPANRDKVPLTLQTRLLFLCGIPLGALILSVVAFEVATRQAAHSIREVTRVSAPLADLARNLQLDVMHIQDAFTDISATRLKDEKDASFATAEKHRQSFIQGIKRFEQDNAGDPTVQKHLAQLTDAINVYCATGREMATAFVTKGTDAGNLLMKDFDRAASQLSATLEPLVADHIAEFNTGLNTTVQLQERLSRWMLIAGMSLVVGSASLALFLTRSITGVLLKIAGPIGDGAEQVAAAAGQVSATSQTLAEGSSEQAASLEETGSSLEELSSMTKRNADSAATAKTLSGETRAAADTGNHDMAEMRQAMDAIKSSSNDIAKIIKTIDEIAFQTNILALNAAVEAARAGEAGSGFAVVAEEVRALAQRSANSAKETAEKIEIAIRNGDHGALISTKVAQSLDVIAEKARKVDELIAEIATASHEQDRGIDQINTAVTQLDQVTQANASNAEETAAASEELNAQAVTLKEAVGQLHQLVGGGRSAPADFPGTYATSSSLAPPKQTISPKPGASTRTSKAAVSSDTTNDFVEQV